VRVDHVPFRVSGRVKKKGKKRVRDVAQKKRMVAFSHFSPTMKNKEKRKKGKKRRPRSDFQRERGGGRGAYFHLIRNRKWGKRKGKKKKKGHRPINGGSLEKKKEKKNWGRGELTRRATYLQLQVS